MARPYDAPQTASFDPQVEQEAGYQDDAMAGQADAERAFNNAANLEQLDNLNRNSLAMAQDYRAQAAAQQRANTERAIHQYNYDTDPVYRAEFDQQQDMSNLGVLLNQAEQTTTARRANLDYGPNKAYTETMRGPEGLMAQGYQAQEGVFDATRGYAQEQAEGLNRISQQVEDENARLYGYDIVENVVGDAGEPIFNEDGTPMRNVVGRQPGLLEVRQAHEQAAMERAKKAETLVTAKAREMQEELGAEGWWSKRTPAQKFGVGLALVLAGIGGGQAVQTMFQAISDYNAEEKAKFGALRESGDESKSLWREIRAQTQSDIEADMLTSNAMLKAALAHNDARAAALGVQVLTAEQQVQRTQILAEIAENERRLATMHAVNEARGPMSTVRVSANSPIRQQVLSKLMDAAIKGDANAREYVYKILGEDRSRAGDLAGKRIEAEGKIGEKRAEKEAEFDNEIKKATQAWGAVEVMIDDFLAANPDDIRGRGIPLTGSRGQRIATDQFFTLLPELVVSAVTGANSSPEQREAAMRLVEGDWNDFTDDDKRARLRALKDMAASQRKYRQRPIASPDAQVQRTDQFKSFAPE